RGPPAARRPTRRPAPRRRGPRGGGRGAWAGGRGAWGAGRGWREMPGRGRRPVNSSPRGAPARRGSLQAPSATDLLRPAPVAPRRVAPVASPLGVGAGGGLALALWPERGGGVGRAAIARRRPAELERRGQ